MAEQRHAGAAAVVRRRGREAMSGHSERRVNPPVGRPMSGGAGAPVGLLKQPACQPRSGRG
ncbi:MAG: hypothetical protein WCL49_10400 [bacterium]